MTAAPRGWAAAGRDGAAGPGGVPQPAKAKAKVRAGRAGRAGRGGSGQAPARRAAFVGAGALPVALAPWLAQPRPASA